MKSKETQIAVTKTIKLPCTVTLVKSTKKDFVRTIEATLDVGDHPKWKIRQEAKQVRPGVWHLITIDVFHTTQMVEGDTTAMLKELAAQAQWCFRVARDVMKSAAREKVEKCCSR